MLETVPANSWDRLWYGPWDAIVIGAGPAGALAARELAGKGVRVLLVEKRRFPRGKVCGGCLNGRALSILDSVGLGSLVAGSGGVPLGGLQLHFRGRLASIRLAGRGGTLTRATRCRTCGSRHQRGGSLFAGDPCPDRRSP